MIYTLLDLETTSLDKWRTEILEVGYLQTNENLEILRSGNIYFYKDNFDVESPAQKVHGLTREFLQQYRDEFEDSIIKLYTLTKNSIIIGKNSNGFDVPVIENFMKRHAPELGPVILADKVDLQKVYANPFRKWYQETTGESAGRRTGKLEELMAVIGYSEEDVNIEFNNVIETVEGRDKAHSALYDAYMTYLLFRDAVKSKKINLEMIGSNLSAEERYYRDTVAAIDEVYEQVDEVPTLFPKAFCSLEGYHVAYKKLNITGMYKAYTFATLLEKLKDERIATEILTESKGQYKLTHNGKTLAFIDCFIYWMVELYARTADTNFLRLCQVFCDYIEYFHMEKRDNPPTFAMHLADYDGDVLKMFVNYVVYLHNNYGRELPKALTDPQVAPLYSSNPSLYLQKVAPPLRLFGDLLRGDIAWERDSVYGVLSIIGAQGGI